jgi:hypothetical protein
LPGDDPIVSVLMAKIATAERPAGRRERLFRWMRVKY